MVGKVLTGNGITEVQKVRYRLIGGESPPLLCPTDFHAEEGLWEPNPSEGRG
jgi:hypothetical protein